MQTRNWKMRKNLLEKLALKNQKGMSEKNDQQQFKGNENFFLEFQHFYNNAKNLIIPPTEFLQEQFHITSLLKDEEIYQLQLELSKQWTPKLRKNWTEEDKQILIWILLKMATRDSFNLKYIPNIVWEEVIRMISRRTVEQCKNKWNSLLKLSLQQIPWTKEQDQLLFELIKKSKEEGRQNKWCNLANTLNKVYKDAPRTGKQCRERWNNHINPDINRNPWSLEEDLELLEVVKKHQKKWAYISTNLRTKRSENAVKNRYNCLLKKHHCNSLNILIDILKTKYKQENPQLPLPSFKRKKMNNAQAIISNSIQETTNKSKSQNSTTALSQFIIQSFDTLEQNQIKTLQPAFINLKAQALLLSSKQQFYNFFQNQMIKIESDNNNNPVEPNVQQLELSNQISGLLNISDSSNYVKFASKQQQIRFIPCLFPQPQNSAFSQEKKSQFNIPGVAQTQPEQQKQTFLKPCSSFSFFSSQQSGLQQPQMLQNCQQLQAEI